MMNTSKLKSELKSELKNALPGEYMITGWGDQDHGNGYDIACSHRPDIYDDIVSIRPDAIVTPIHVSGGYLAAYQVIIPDPQLLICACQHSGNWGPWYHLSAYRKSSTAKSGYVFDHLIGGHYKCHNIPTSAQYIGRPNVTDMESIQ